VQAKPVSRLRRQTIDLVLVLLLVGCVGPVAPRPQAPQRRLALLRQDVTGAELRRALEDEDVVVRRTSARLLGGRGATEALSVAMGDEDLLVRRIALATLLRAGGEPALNAVGQALSDSSSLVRLLAVEHLASLRPHSERVLDLLELACQDGDEKVREIATRATWPFFRRALSVRDGGTDLDITAAETIRLPAEEWRFHLDPLRQGHRQHWFDPDFDDTEWAQIAIEQTWQQAGYEYIGVTWYRRTFELPDSPESFAVDIRFGAVDESAWVWINGIYAGDHDIGPGGWNVPFRWDVTELLRWGEANHITVRAMNTAHAGGIWKPINIEVLRR
jgi:hypothetical protein